MKIAIKYLLICFLFVFTSCSSSDNTEPDLGPTYYQKLNVDGTQVKDLSFHDDPNGMPAFAYRSFDLLRLNINYVNAANNIEYQFRFNFNEYGDLGEVYIAYQPPWPSGYLWYKNFLYDAAQHFHFVLEEYDAVKNTVKGNYSGKIYIDPEDENSDFITVEGSFHLKIIDEQNSVTHLYKNIKLNMNGQDWKVMQRLDRGSFPYEGAHDDIALQFVSDDKFKIVMGYVRDNQIGSHTFDNTSTNFFVKLGKYNPMTNQFDYYIISHGMLSLTTSQYMTAVNYQTTGTFSFAATNPFPPYDTINVTNGSFDLLLN